MQEMEHIVRRYPPKTPEHLELELAPESYGNNILD